MECLYILYIRPIIEYCNSIFDNCSAADSARIERLQYNAARICTGALVTTSNIKLLEEVGWPTLKDRRCSKKIMVFFKAITDKLPPYASQLFTQYKNTHRNMALRRNQAFRLPLCRTSHFKSSQIPSSISIWNALSNDVTTISSVFIMKSYLKSKYGVKSPAPHYYMGKRKPCVLHTRLRLQASTLNADQFRNGFHDRPDCECGNSIENNSHYILHCPKFKTARAKLFVGIRDLLAPGASPYLLPQLDPDYFVKMLLFGRDTDTDTDANLNKQIVHCLQTFITESGRFQK